jgi:hypothetical protein
MELSPGVVGLESSNQRVNGQPGLSRRMLSVMKSHRLGGLLGAGVKNV